jgi:hypothetical protein
MARPQAKQHRAQVLEVGQHRPEPGPRGHAQQLALLHQVRGEEQGEGDLGELAGLEAHRAHGHPDAGAADVAADAGQQG